jgi:hypothetical protein
MQPGKRAHTVWVNRYGISPLQKPEFVAVSAAVSGVILRIQLCKSAAAGI